VLKGLGRGGKSKVQMWDDLKLLSWSRTLSATWLVSILDLLLRVQLNILGRHLFVQQQWYPPPPPLGGCFPRTVYTPLSGVPRFPISLSANSDSPLKRHELYGKQRLRRRFRAPLKGVYTVHYTSRFPEALDLLLHV